MSMEQRAAKRAEISKMLSSIAGVLIAGALTLTIFAVEKSNPGIYFWILLAISILCVTGSVVMSAAAIDEDSAGKYNMQSILLGIGLLGFISLVPFSLPDEREKSLPPVSLVMHNFATELHAKKISELEARIEKLESRCNKNVRFAMPQIRNEGRKAHTPL